MLGATWPNHQQRQRLYLDCWGGGDKINKYINKFSLMKGKMDPVRKGAVRNASEFPFWHACLSLSAHSDRYQLIANLTLINTYTGCQRRKLKFSLFDPPNTHTHTMLTPTSSFSFFFFPLCSCLLHNFHKGSFPFQITADPFTDPGGIEIMQCGSWASLMRSKSKCTRQH